MLGIENGFDSFYIWPPDCFQTVPIISTNRSCVSLHAPLPPFPAPQRAYYCLSTTFADGSTINPITRYPYIHRVSCISLPSRLQLDHEGMIEPTNTFAKQPSWATGLQLTRASFRMTYGSLIKRVVAAMAVWPCGSRNGTDGCHVRGVGGIIKSLVHTNQQACKRSVS
jgi:hypothetical protein